MGWTTRVGMSAQDSIRAELAGCDVLRSSGAWYVCRNSRGDVFMVQALTQRDGADVSVKMVQADAGPFGCPSESLYRFYVRARNDRPVTEYETEWRERCEGKYAAARRAPKLQAGDVFRLRSAIHYTDGVVEDTFRFGERFTGYRVSDGRRVRLPKGFRSWIVADSDTAL